MPYISVNRSRIAEIPASISAYHGIVDLGCRDQVQLVVICLPTSM
jgi:hypothetical protein